MLKFPVIYFFIKEFIITLGRQIKIKNMYTFLISAAVSFLIAAVIFGKKLKQNLFFAVLIVIGGSLIGVSAVNGIVGMNIPFTEVKVKEAPLDKELCKIITPTDTIEFVSYLEYDYQMKKDSSIKYNSLDFDYADYYSPDENGRLSRLSINWLPVGDSIPRYERWREKRIVKDNKWISQFGIPNGKRINKIYIPQDSIHMVLINHLNDKFFTNDETKIALAN